MNIDKFLKQLKEEVEGNIFPTSLSPAMTKRAFVYGSQGNTKGTMRSTAQTRKDLVKEKNLQNLIPAFQTGFEYIIAAAYGTPLQQRMVSEVKRIQRIVKQVIERESRKGK